MKIVHRNVQEKYIEMYRKAYKEMVLRDGWLLVKVIHRNVQESSKRSGLKRGMASCEGGLSPGVPIHSVNETEATALLPQRQNCGRCPCGLCKQLENMMPVLTLLCS